MKALKVIGNIFLWLFIIFAALMTVLALTSQNYEGVPSIFGIMPTTIGSDSMSKPKDATGDEFKLSDGTTVKYAEIKKGDWILNEIVEGADKDALIVGDIITFKADVDGDGKKNELKTHRIVSINRNTDMLTFNTKGDNNFINDSESVASYEVLSKYTGFKIPAAGAAIDFLQSSIGFLCCIVIPLIIFFLYELYRFILVVASRKKKVLSDEEEEEIKKQAIEEYLAQQKEKNVEPVSIVNNTVTGVADKED